MSAQPAPEKNKLYHGDNLDVIRRYIPDESVDLIYLDPPFNSRQDLTSSSPKSKTAFSFLSPKIVISTKAAHLNAAQRRDPRISSSA